MSVSETDKIDLANIDPRTDDVVLTITDHLDWSDKPEKHLLLLQEKLNAYLRFVESGEIYGQIPLAIGRKIRFRVIGRFPLSDEARRFYLVVGKSIEDAGFALSFELFESESSS